MLTHIFQVQSAKLNYIPTLQQVVFAREQGLLVDKGKICAVQVFEVYLSGIEAQPGMAARDSGRLTSVGI